MKIRHWTDHNKCDILDVIHIVAGEIFGLQFWLTWATHYTTPIEGTYPKWKWENKPFIRLRFRRCAS